MKPGQLALTIIIVMLANLAFWGGIGYAVFLAAKYLIDYAR